MRIALICVWLAVVLGLASAAPAWKVDKLQFATVADDITCPSELKCLSALADNGQGSAVLYTDDGAQSWVAQTSKQEMMYLGSAAIGNTAVLQAMFDAEYASLKDGSYNFTSSKISGSVGLQGQDAFGFDEQTYALVGEGLGGGNGIALSFDGGQTFKFDNISALTTWSRYGAFGASKDVIYVTAGQWPQNKVKTHPEAQRVNKHFSVVRGKNARVIRHKSHGLRTGEAGGWAAQIVKSTDGGKTWTSVYSDNTFYFNQISCMSDDSCCAVGEADSGAGSGIRILCTNDGGKTWQQNLRYTQASMSIMAIDCPNAQECYAGGGDMSGAFTGHVYYSSNSGKSWQVQASLQGVYINDISMPSSTRGYATAFNSLDTCSLITYA